MVVQVFTYFSYILLQNRLLETIPTLTLQRRVADIFKIFLVDWNVRTSFSGVRATEFFSHSLGLGLD